MNANVSGPQSKVYGLRSFLFLPLVLGLAGTARATEYLVATNGLDTGANTGTNGWGDALLTISNAVAKATNPGDIVTVSNGTYNVGVQITISAGITIRSFGNGVYGGLANAANTIVRNTTVPSRVFNISNAGAEIDGLTITGGTGWGGWDGNGVYMTGGLIRNCVISNNGGYDNMSGGGIYMSNGTVSNCVVKSNSKGGGIGSGGGIYANGGLIVSCEIADNSARALDGGGVYLGGAATIRNCLIARNTSARCGGGVHLANASAVIESCTIVANYAADATSGGGGIYRANIGTVRNCIVYNNTSAAASYQNTYSTGTSGWTTNCTRLPDVAGAGCINGDPLFRNLLEGNYRLSTGSPCIDAGNDAAVTWATDLDGKTRKQDIPGVGSTSVDMGAYEYDSSLNCDFLASPRYLIASPTTYQCFGTAPFTAQFTATAGGTNLTGLGYLWDFDGDGNYDQTNDTPTVSHVYSTPGVYSPKLQVTNSAAEVGMAVKTNYVSAGSTHYVVTNNPGAASPYTSWATAASNSIQAAVNQAALLRGSQVIVSNGTYNTTAQIAIGAALTIHSFDGSVTGGLANASKTIVRQTTTGYRVISITANNAGVDGLTLRGARADNFSQGQGYGNGVYLAAAATVRNCIITDNGFSDRVYGGGVYMNNSGAVVSNCVISANGANNGAATGGGVNMTAGLLVSCIVSNNSASSSDGGLGGGGAYMSGGTVRNCLIAYNSSVAVGGGVRLDGGTVESSTIVSNNTTSASGGGGLYRNGGTAGTVLNCIVYNNTAPNNGTYKNTYSGTSGWTCNDTTLPDVPGVGCINSVPLFQDVASKDYRLKACAAVDAGTNQAWMAGAFDLAGTNRIINSIVDMGAYEFVPGALECALAANATTVLAPSNVVFIATVFGSNLTSRGYTWDFGDGNSTNGPGLGVVTNLYSNPGVYTVALTVTNGVGEVASDTNANYITVWAANAYVWTNSPSPAVPYTNWATAARLIGTALSTAPAGVTIWATNGTYNETVENLVYRRITIRSVEGNLSGASNTIVRANAALSYRLFSLLDANAVLQGLSIQDTLGSFNGCGVYMSAGLVRDCIIRNNGGCDNHLGSGVYMSGGTVSNCVVKNNGGGSNVDGAGIYATGGSILYCQILDNALTGAEGGSAGGGGIYANGAVTIRNSLIARNLAGGTAGGDKGGGGVYLANGTIESCTIVSNRAVGANGGGGVYRGSSTAGTVSNSVVYFNTTSASTYSNVYTTVATGIGNTCTTNPVVAGNNCITANPLFNNIGSGDYTLSAISPCIDAGSNQAWMAGALDLAGNARKQYGTVAGSRADPVVDMGCYETFIPSKGTVLLVW